MVVIGIDFGNDSCTVTTVHNRKLTAIVNDYNKRKIDILKKNNRNKKYFGFQWEIPNVEIIGINLGINERTFRKLKSFYLKIYFESV